VPLPNEVYSLEEAQGEIQAVYKSEELLLSRVTTYYFIAFLTVAACTAYWLFCCVRRLKIWFATTIAQKGLNLVSVHAVNTP